MAWFRAALVSALVAVAASEMHENVEHMYMSRTVGSDLKPSASGYIYRSDSHGPASYVKLGSGAVHHQLNAFPAPALVPPRPLPYGGYAAAPQHPNPGPFLLRPQLPANVVLLPQKTYGAPIVAVHKQAPVNEEASDESSDDDEENSDEGGDEESSDFGNDRDDYSAHAEEGALSSPNYAADFEADTGYGNTAADSGYHGRSIGHGGHGGFESGGGKHYGADGHAAHGDKGEKGYKQASHFDKGQEGHFDKEGHKGHYSKGAGHKSGHEDNGHHYNEHHAASKGHKGGEFSEKKGHKKGSKTTGFHNVYHKDEFKKEHKFYDDAHKSGKHGKHGAGESHHHAAHGEHVKGGKHDSAYHDAHHGKKGHGESGHVAQNDQGHASKAGEEAYHSHHSDFAKKGGHSGGSESGYAAKH